MKNSRFAPFLALAAIVLLVGWIPFHLELEASYPEADAALEEAPSQIWLRFSVEPDMERTSFSVRGPQGTVELGAISTGEEAEIIVAQVGGEMPAGNYTLSWIGAPLDDHTVRGRFNFSIEGADSASR
jgi:methionine-rich copper-binding protein CopC